MSDDVLGKLKLFFEQFIPFNRFLGMQVTELRPGFARIELPFRAEFIGNPEVPALHGGILSALIDTCGGAATWSQIDPVDRVATVDLRVDYLRPGRLEHLVGEGEVIRLGNQVAVVGLRAYHPGARDKPVAVGMGVYNIRRTEDA